MLVPPPLSLSIQRSEVLYFEACAEQYKTMFTLWYSLLFMSFIWCSIHPSTIPYFSQKTPWPVTASVSAALTLNGIATKKRPGTPHNPAGSWVRCWLFQLSRVAHLQMTLLCQILLLMWHTTHTYTYISYIRIYVYIYIHYTYINSFKSLSSYSLLINEKFPFPTPTTFLIFRHFSLNLLPSHWTGALISRFWASEATNAQRFFRSSSVQLWDP